MLDAGPTNHMPAEVKRAKNDWPWIAWVTEKRREAEYTPPYTHRKKRKILLHAHE
jgi:hypothetical protein